MKIYIIKDLRERILVTFSDAASYEKAVENYNKYPVAFTKCEDMKKSFSQKIKLHLKRGNSIKDKIGKELEKSFLQWEYLMDKAWTNPTDFFIKMNNLTIDI